MYILIYLFTYLSMLYIYIYTRICYMCIYIYIYIYVISYHRRLSGCTGGGSPQARPAASRAPGQGILLLLLARSISLISSIISTISIISTSTISTTLLVLLLSLARRRRLDLFNKWQWCVIAL